jgi:hypothetical protein
MSSVIAAYDPSLARRNSRGASRLAADSLVSALCRRPPRSPRSAKSWSNASEAPQSPAWACLRSTASSKRAADSSPLRVRQFRKVVSGAAAASSPASNSRLRRATSVVAATSSPSSARSHKSLNSLVFIIGWALDAGASGSETVVAPPPSARSHSSWKRARVASTSG